MFSSLVHLIPSLNISYPYLIKLVGTRDGRTQSARAWLSGPEFQDLDKRTRSFRTSIDGQLGSGFQDLDRRTSVRKNSGYPWRSDTIRPCLALRTWVSGPRETDTGFQDLDKRTLGFRTSTDGQLGSGFQDLETKRKAKNQRKERLPPPLFPEENPFVCPSVRPPGPVPP